MMSIDEALDRRDKVAAFGERVLEILRPYKSQYAGVPENSTTAARMLDVLRARNELGLLDEEARHGR